MIAISKAVSVSPPVDLVTGWYVQLRMIATLAIMGGFDPSEDSVRTLAHICLTGSSAGNILKEAGIRFANKAAMSAIKKDTRKSSYFHKPESWF